MSRNDGCCAPRTKQQCPTSDLVIAKQGSFMVGGSVTDIAGTFVPTCPTSAGQTIHGDHAYVQFQIPANAKKLPIVFWHGGVTLAYSGKTWETTPDGRDGFLDIFLRRGFAVYNLDQARRGRAGKAPVAGTIVVPPAAGYDGEQGAFIRFRLGIWPTYFPNVQFATDAATLNQWFRQATPNTAPINYFTDYTRLVDPVVQLFNQIGPGILVTHSANSVLAEHAAIASPNIKALWVLEPSLEVFPASNTPPDVPVACETTVINSAVPDSDFAKLAQIPIQFIWGDNFPLPGDPATPYPSINHWTIRYGFSQQFVSMVNGLGGNASLIHLPSIGINGNTHFIMQDLNNLRIADFLSRFLYDNGLDG